MFIPFDTLLFAVGLITPVAERLTELVKPYIKWNPQIISTIAGILVAPLAWWAQGAETSLWVYFLAGGLVSLPAGFLHDLFGLLNASKKKNKEKSSQ